MWDGAGLGADDIERMGLTSWKESGMQNENKLETRGVSEMSKTVVAIEKNQTKWHWQVHLRSVERVSVANR